MRKSIRLFPILVLTPLLLTGCGTGRSGSKPTTADQLVQAGLLQMNQGDQAAALSSFRQAALKQPTNVFAHYDIGVILQQQGKNAEALSAYGDALVAKSDFVPALFNSAIIYGATDPNLAMSTYRKILTLQPQAPTAYLNLGLLEAAQGQEAQARKDLTMAVQQDGSLVNSIPKDTFSAKKSKAPATPTTTPSS